jgi:dihydrolipoamide dehydrogenase
MLAGTAVYVNAGTSLGQIENPGDILSLELLLAFSLLGVFPLIAKRMIDYWKKHKALAGWKKPGNFDRNLLVIGAGAAGLVSSYIGATVKAKVTLIEKNRMGGDCLNTGCVPSKALLRSAKIASYINRAREFGLEANDVRVDFPAVMERIQNIIQQVEPHDSVERYTELGVDCIQGEAKITSPWTVQIDGEDGTVLSARNIIVAAGGRPKVPDLPGLENVRWHTSDSIWEIREAPRKLLILGGGPIGCELAQAFHRLNIPVTLVQRRKQLLPREDEDVADQIKQKFEQEGIQVLTGHEAKSIQQGQNMNQLVCKNESETVELDFDCLLFALGREANTESLGLDRLGVKLNPDHTINVNEYMQTSVPTIYACGDIAGPYQFTHVAAHQAWYASVNSLFGMFKKFRVDYSVIPWCTFTDPEVARVGLNEKEASEQGIAFEVTRYGIDDLDRAMADGEAHGFIKVLTAPGKDRILGATIVGYHAGELITEFIQAMKNNIGLNRILGTIHIYPTLSESNKYLAGEWKKARKPETLLNLVEAWHRSRL